MKRYAAPPSFLLLIFLLFVSSCSDPSRTLENAVFPTNASTSQTDSTPRPGFAPTPGEVSLPITRIPLLSDCNDLGIDACVALTIAEGGRLVTAIEDEEKHVELTAYWEQKSEEFQSCVEVQKDKGQMGANPDGEAIFLDEISLSTLQYAREIYLISIMSKIKWSGFGERSSKDRQVTAQVVGDYTGQEIVYLEYLETSQWIENPLRMVEVYRSGEQVFQVDIENNRIVSIESSQRFGVCGHVFNLDNMLAKAFEYIARLAPDVNLNTLAFYHDEGCLYFVWNDEGILLPGSQFGRIFIEIREGGELNRFHNTLYVE